MPGKAAGGRAGKRTQFPKEITPRYALRGSPEMTIQQYRDHDEQAVIVLSEEAYELVLSGQAKKGDVLATARIAGIMAAKKTSELIPLCHPLALSHAGIEFE